MVAYHRRISVDGEDVVAVAMGNDTANILSNWTSIELSLSSMSLLGSILSYDNMSNCLCICDK